MAEKFSGAVRLADLNDFIAPSQTCMITTNKATTDGMPIPVTGVVQLQKRKLVDFDLPKAEHPSIEGPVKISLHDCLACSGCITSAETVMLQQQSTDELLSQLNTKDKFVVVSVSPQSRASLATHFNITPLQAFQKLTTFLKALGVHVILDTSSSRDISLMEASEEFVYRYKESDKKGSLPMLASACPGWVCYAEKTHGSYILPYISSTKSPQQVMGSIIKRFLAQRLNSKPEDIYHVTVMPCYDKKLEAAREDFIFAVDRLPTSELNTEEAGPRPQSAKEVDCVLTSGEILDLIQTQSVDFLALEETPLDKLLTNIDENGHLYGVRGGSGGYLEIIFRHAAKVLFGKDVNGPLEMKILRNSDFQEVSLMVEGKRVLHFAAAYGFRNIQNLVRKIKLGKCEYHFIEIMACPSGCLNGGGQIKPRKGQPLKDHIQRLEGVYLQEMDVRDPAQNPLALGLYKEWLGAPYSEKARELLHTQYHERTKSVSTQIANW